MARTWVAGGIVAEVARTGIPLGTEERIVSPEKRNVFETRSPTV